MKIFFTILFVLLYTANVFSQTTFNKHIAPIIFKHCVSCHRDGEIAPFPLTNYEEVSQMAYTIRAVTQSGSMPPWKAEKGFGYFLDERILTQQEKDAISKWIDEGLAEGNPSDLPTLPNFPKGSQLGVPDLVLKLKNPWKIEGNSKDSYRNFVLDLPISEDVDIAAVEFRPGNTKVVHHALMWLDTTGEAKLRDDESPEEGYDGFGGPGFSPTLSYGGWVPGATSRFYPPGIGNKMFKNGKFLVQIHYAASVTEEFDQSTINIFFKKNEPAIRQIFETTMSPRELKQAFIIPANQKRQFVASYLIPIDVSVYALAPHQHLLGTAAKAYAVTFKGDTIPLVNVPKWDFNWQGAFTFQKLVKIPAFSTLYYEAEYDNTSDNPFNPNTPPKVVTWGERTIDEMFLCYFHFMQYEDGDELIELGPKKDTVSSTNQYPEIIGMPKAMITELYPSPIQTNSSLRMYIPYNAAITVNLTSLEGKNVATLIESQWFSEGYHSISLPFDQYISGKYFLQLRSPNGVHTVPVTIVR